MRKNRNHICCWLYSLHIFLHSQNIWLPEHPNSNWFVFGCECTGSDKRQIVACRVASKYPFAKVMEIAESVPTGLERQATSDKILNFYNFMCALLRQATILSLVARVVALCAFNAAFEKCCRSNFLTKSSMAVLMCEFGKILENIITSEPFLNKYATMSERKIITLLSPLYMNIRMKRVTGR